MADKKGNGASKPTVATPAVNGKAYPIQDHAYDVVVVGTACGYALLKLSFGV
jgi:hypothetical protein